VPDSIALLSSWQSFYVVIGSSAGALTGLMFVVITLVAGSRLRPANEPIAAFSTPNVVHFCAALLVSAILSVPWETFSSVAVLLGLCGAGGVVYVFVVLHRARRQADYVPVLEDWIWHTILPFAAYGSFIVTAFLLLSTPESALFVTGAGSMLLLFAGIHNAWDIVTYVVVEQARVERKSQG